ncbi:MAG: hypothetical protein K8R53_12150 [Bacteroidales bacterium]|nr:hypothetical protein [Bacteroidales bacterium]
MKKIMLIFAIVLSPVYLTAQPADTFKYQAVVRDSTGDVMSFQNVSFQISIVNEEVGGEAVYVETHDTITNQFGLVCLNIGMGNVVLGSLEDIPWGERSFYMQVEMDAKGGADYMLMNKAELIGSVARAVHAKLLTLKDSNGNLYNVGVDTMGNLVTTKVIFWSCGDILVDERDGKNYNTVKIGTQCWMAENLNIGIMILGNNNQSHNDTIEKYCYNDSITLCDEYGGLYQWSEMIQYSTTQGGQGICPTGWHLPTDEEWKQLEGEVDSQYNYPDPEWDNTGYRGADAGYNLKSASSWFAGGNGSDLYGFTAISGGYCNSVGTFLLEGDGCHFWTYDANSFNDAWYRKLSYNNTGVFRDSYHKENGNYVRCVKN